MFPKMNPKQMEKMMKQMGMNMEEIPADKVTIESGDKKIIIEGAQVSKISAMGQDTYQVAGGNVSEEGSEAISEDDVKMIVDSVGCSKKEAEKALGDSEGDIAAAIMKLKG